MLKKWKKNLKIKAIVLTGIVCIFGVSTATVRAQEQNEAENATKEKTEKVEEAKPEKPADPKAATTTKELDISPDELKVIAKPLTEEELRNEAAAWLLILQAKAKEISIAEVTIKRQNQAISQQKEGADALEKAKLALEEAEKVQKSAAPGSPEAQAAAKKVAEAQENLKKAQSAVNQAQETKQEIKQSSTLKKAEKTGNLTTAKQIIDKIKADRDRMVAGSVAYTDATKTIEKLEAAIAAFEDAQQAQQAAKPDSPEYNQATQQVEKTYETLKQVLKEIGGDRATQSSSEQSSQTLNQGTTSIENTEIKNNGEEQVAGLPGVVNNPQNLQQKQQELEKTTEQLQQSADKESEAKNQLVVTVTELQSQLTAIVDRFNVILDELEKKGGDVKSYRQYIQAVTAVEVDTKDTEGMGLRLISWAKSDEGGMRWANNTGKFLGVFLISIIVAQILGIIINRLLALFSSTSVLMRRFIVMVVKRGGVVVGFMLALTALEVSLGPILALVGGVSFVLAFALQSNLGNLASGLMIMAYKPFDVGDEIKIGELWGIVDSITLANTKIKGFNDQIFNVPNNTVWGETIENLSHGKIRQIRISLRVAFNYNLTQVEQLLVEIIKSHPKVVEDPAPETWVWNIEDYYISLDVKAWVKRDDFWQVHQDAIRMIQERFNQEGIELAAIPKGIEIAQENDSSAEIPYLVSHTPVHRAAGSISDNPTNLEQAVEAVNRHNGYSKNTPPPHKTN